MLVRLFGENFRSFRDKFELSMVAADLRSDQDRDRGVVEVQLDGQDEPLRLLRCAAIYGANASGKSTVLLAANALRWFLIYRSEKLESDASFHPYEPFTLEPDTAKIPVQLGCTIVSAGALYEYEIQYLAKTIIHESLKRISDDITTIFERTGDGPVTGTLVADSEVIKLYVQDMHPSVSVLSKLALQGPAKADESVTPYYEAILSSLTWEDYGRVHTGQRLFDPIAKRFSEDDEFKNWVMINLIRPADIGIVDVEVSTVDLDLPKSFRARLAEESGSTVPDQVDEVQFMHSGLTDKKLDFMDESAGTKKLYNLSEDWWNLATKETALFADELSASLHPRLFDALIRSINTPQSAQSRSQLIFATHDTGLLEGRDGKPPALRRDQVFFTEKDSDGATKLYSLVEFKDGARGVHNIRKRYLSGRYGAMPMPEGISL